MVRMLKMRHDSR